jgi:hypothetical protein
MRTLRAAGIAIVAAALFVSLAPAATRAAQDEDPQRNTANFQALIDALNAEDEGSVNARVATDFTLYFFNANLVMGQQAVQLLMLLDTPITVVSITPGPGMSGVAIVRFGGSTIQYTIRYGATPDGIFSGWQIDAPGDGSPGQ